jgi:hypothetical protein
MARMPRGQAWILVVFIALALLGAFLVSGFKTFERGVDGGGMLWALLAVAGILLGFAAFRLLRETHHRQEP